ncbi:hypothetical protein OA954_05300 [Alphaproteobacteria bacterium]|nr:hypothetical protein [Alphaproteobacteria bacterium]
MKVLFITLEQSGRQILKSLLDEKFFNNNKNQIYTFGMDNNYKDFVDITNIKINSIMGFVNIILNFKYLFKLRSKVNEVILDHSFTHIFFIDSFDFSKFYLKKFKSNKIKYCQIVGPSVFIWKSKKANFINNNFDRIFSIFKIEQPYYKPDLYRYIGHPLMKKTHLSNSYNVSLKNIGIFLGSRRQEIHKNIYIINNLLKSLKDQKDLIFNFFITEDFKEFIKNTLKGNSNLIFHINDNSYYKKISKLDFAFACSGSVHLELCFSNIPHIIFYKANYINYFIFKFFVRSNFLSLVNIFNKKEIIKEYIQSDFNTKNLLFFFKNLRSDKKSLINYRNEMLSGLANSNFTSFRPNIIIDYLEKFS